MTYKEISIGARDAGADESVKTLQRMLNETGSFRLEEDGIFGVNTQNAVKTYQKANDLTVDGIVGDQTWSSLTKNQHPVLGDAAADTPDTPRQPSYTDYTARLEELYDAWSEREPFSYQAETDPLYQQYKDLYTRQGQLAMLDTMGQAAALTGGYGNSYGQTAGQLAFQDYMQRLGAAVPELYGAAYDRYNGEGDRLLQQYTLARDMADTAYARQSDNYNKLTTLLPLGYSPTDEELTAAGMTRPQANTISGYYNNQNTPTRSTGSYAPSYDNKGFDSSIIRKAQQAVGASVDGLWGTQSQSKAKAAGYDSLAEVLAAMFTGTTYEDAANFLKQMGAGDEIGNATSGTGLMYEDFWKIWKGKEKGDYSIPEYIQYAIEYDSYQAYLKAYITSALER